MTEQQRKKAELIKLLIKKGWNPPTPTNRIVERIADDIERLNERGLNHITSPTLSLTPTQLTVLTQTAGGLTKPEIATQLGIGQETVKTHMRTILDRLGAKNSSHAVAIAVRHGLINVDEHAWLPDAA